MAVGATTLASLYAAPGTATIAEDEDAWPAKPAPPLSEQAEFERLAYDCDAVIATLRRWVEREPENIWHRQAQGDIRVTLGGAS